MLASLRYVSAVCLGSVVALTACSSDDGGSSSSGDDTSTSGGSAGESGESSGGNGGTGDTTTSDSGGTGGTTTADTTTGGTGGTTTSDSGGTGGTTTSDSGGTTTTETTGTGGSTTATTSAGGTGGSTTATTSTGGTGGSPCGDCQAVCLETGECVECGDSTDCSAPNAAVCDIATHTCVECTPGEDTCETGYCSEGNECVLGCNNEIQCVSGVCGGTNDCTNCVSDNECASGRVCGSGVCDVACTGEGTECGTGGSCCSDHCVDVARDIQHCGACGVACQLAEFCTSDATVECVDVTFANICRHEIVTMVGDGLSIDVAAGTAILGALTNVANCDPAPASRSLSQTDADVINNTSGQPVVGPGELLIATGGSFGNLVSEYLITSETAPVYNRIANGSYFFTRTSNDTDIASITAASQTATHDLLVIQLARDPLTGTLMLNAYGFGAVGTTAAGWYVANVMAPALASYTDSWYVYEWTDDAADGPSNANEFVLGGSG